MKAPNFLRRRQPGTISSLYGTIVAQARLASFYREYGVADTVNGRFDMLVLHLALFLRRLAGEPETIRALGQGVFDQFCQDMDHNLREMGVGDMRVPDEMRRIGAAYFGRAQAYDAALAACDHRALKDAIARNVYGSEAAVAAGRLAAYMLDAADKIAAQDVAAFQRGKLRFPDPVAVSEPVKR